MPSFTDDQIYEVSVDVMPNRHTRGRPILIGAGNGCEEGAAYLSPETATDFAAAILRAVIEYRDRP